MQRSTADRAGSSHAGGWGRDLLDLRKLFVSEPSESDPSSSWVAPSSSHRLRHLTLAERCDVGLIDPGLRCNSGLRFGGSAESASDGADASVLHSISGRVMGRDGLGIGGVTLIAIKGVERPGNISGRRARHRTVSDADGFYTFRKLPAGDYTIRNNELGAYPSLRISAHTGVEYADLVLYEERSFTVEGQVSATTGEPLERVTVLPIVRGVPSATTDADGRYRMPVSLPQHVRSLRLRFQLPGFRETYLAAIVPQPGAPGSTIVDAEMAPIEYTTAVTGTVTASDGTPLAGRNVKLRPIAEQRIFNAMTDEDGRFSFPFVEAPLDYRLQVHGAPDFRDYQQQIRITAFESELDIVIEPYEFAELSGQVVNLEGVPVPDITLVLRNTASESPNALITSDERGNFTVPSAPAGELVIASQSMPSFLLKGLHARPGDKLSVPLVLDWGEHEIRGLVLDRHGNPVPASRVLLRWSHESGGISSTSTRRTAADAQGSFEFSRLGPGPHSIEVDAPGHPTIALDHDVRRNGYDITVRLN